MSVSAQAPPGPDPGTPPDPEPGDGAGRPARPPRPLVVTGGIAACAAAASGLAVLVTLTAIGWITAPHVGLGSGLGGVLRTAANLWLVAHHVGFTVHGAGRIGLLPLGLVLLPGALLVLAGRWVVRAGSVTRLRHVGYAALALALPYALLAGALALASRTPGAVPSLTEAVVASFLLALLAGGLGAARALAPWSRLARLMPARPRSIVMGMLGAVALLTAAGAALAAGSLAVHLPEVRAASDALSPGVGGAALLLLAQLAYVPNAIIWAVAYALGPGFAFGAGTAVTPTASSLGAVPVFPMLAALPGGGAANHPGALGLLPVLVLAMPYLAGVFAGVVTVRISPTPVLEAAPLWGFAAGAAAGAVFGVAAAFSGGPLGNGRLAAVGPSGFAVGLVAILEIGVTAALAAAAANWFILHRATRRRHAAARQPVPPNDSDAEDIAQDLDASGYDTDYDDDGYRGIGSGGALPDPDRDTLPRGIVDESDDDGGHRIFFNPWASHDDGTHDDGAQNDYDDEAAGYEAEEQDDDPDPGRPSRSGSPFGW